MLQLILLLIVFFALASFGVVLLAAAVAAYQESLIWAAKPIPSLSWVGLTKVFLFNVFWMVLSFLVSLVILFEKAIALFGFEPLHDGHYFEKVVAKLIFHWLIGDVQVIGADNLPPTDLSPAPIYIANHSSQVDVAAVYFIERKFRWVAKSSVLYLPGVGLLMWLADHIFVNRKRKKNEGRSSFYSKAGASVKSGLPLLIYPQGTRRLAEQLPAKNGAFIVAIENSTLLCPLSVEVPLTSWNSLHPLSGNPSKVILTIHEPIQVKEGDDLERRKQQCMTQIYSVLPDYSTKEE